MNCKNFDGVTETVFQCVKAKSRQEHDTVYDPPDADQGTATTNVPVVGTIELTFDRNPSTNVILYCIVKKPFIVSNDQIFNGIADTISACKG
jgi:hypothetical protein